MNEKKYIYTHIGRNEAGSFDEGAADVEEVPKFGTGQVTARQQRHTQRQPDLSGASWIRVRLRQVVQMS